MLNMFKNKWVYIADCTKAGALIGGGSAAGAINSHLWLQAFSDICQAQYNLEVTPENCGDTIPITQEDIFENTYSLQWKILAGGVMIGGLLGLGYGLCTAPTGHGTFFALAQSGENQTLGDQHENDHENSESAQLSKKGVVQIRGYTR